MRPSLYLSTLGALAVALIAALVVWQLNATPGAVFDAGPPSLSTSGAPAAERVIVVIEKGDDARAIAGKLERAGVIPSALRFRVMAALVGAEKKLGSGEYLLQKGLPTAQVIDRLRLGALAQRLVTIREGLRAEEIGAILEEKGVVPQEEFLRAIAIDYRGEFDFLRGLPPEATVEGYLFPDTYDFPSGAKAEDVVRRLLANFGRRFGPTLRQGAAQQGLSIHQVVTLAAIVEREAQVAEERPLIANVFLRRLTLDMPLAADPTVQYALGNDATSVADHGYWKKELTLDDLKVDSPYNTYVRVGLPPAPIANPGLASLTAVVRPTAAQYLFFVAKPDGSHAFAETLAEHQQNIRRYQGQ